jgi:hypothetical protein
MNTILLTIKTLVKKTDHLTTACRFWLSLIPAQGGQCFRFFHLKSRTNKVFLIVLLFNEGFEGHEIPEKLAVTRIPYCDGMFRGGLEIHFAHFL